MSSAEIVLDPYVELDTRRRRGLGRERIYVRVGGLEVGYRDLKTGQVVCPSGEYVELVHRMTYLPRHAAPEPAA